MGIGDFGAIKQPLRVKKTPPIWMGLEYKHIGWWQLKYVWNFHPDPWGRFSPNLTVQARAKHPLEKRGKNTSKVSNEVPQ